MALQGEAYSQIKKLLGIHPSCITNWKKRFLAQGIEGIKLGYQGAKSYLTLLVKSRSNKLVKGKELLEY